MMQLKVILDEGFLNCRCEFKRSISDPSRSSKIPGTIVQHSTPRQIVVECKLSLRLRTEPTLVSFDSVLSADAMYLMTAWSWWIHLIPFPSPHSQDAARALFTTYHPSCILCIRQTGRRHIACTYSLISLNTFVLHGPQVLSGNLVRNLLL
jgi:hypothetical protein